MVDKLVALAFMPEGEVCTYFNSIHTVVFAQSIITGRNIPKPEFTIRSISSYLDNLPTNITKKRKKKNKNLCHYV